MSCRQPSLGEKKKISVPLISLYSRSEQSEHNLSIMQLHSLEDKGEGMIQRKGGIAVFEQIMLWVSSS